MKIIKTILEIILITIISICAFGGGCLIYIAIGLFFHFEQLSSTIFILSALLPCPICWYIAPKISDKIL